MKNKSGLQISFAWIFAIIVGGFILFLAIYSVTKIIGTERQISDTEIAKEIEVLLNPLETGFETSKTTSLVLPSESRIYTNCSDFGNFGEQTISISQKSFGDWSDVGISAKSQNKYLFSEEYVEGKRFYLFSKPFEFPFKVSDLIYLTSADEEYCFVDADESIQEELQQLNQRNLLAQCTARSIKVCFSEKSGCDILVNVNQKFVEKNGSKVYFEGDALMYAGIFADKENYECQLKR